MNILTIISFATLILTDIQRISQDGEITADEVAEIVLKAVKISGVDLKIKL